MMINIYDSLHTTYMGRFISYSIKFTAIKDEDHVIFFKHRKFMDNSISAGKKTIIGRSLVLIINHNFFACIQEHVIQGQLRSQGITVKSHMGSNKKEHMSIYHVDDTSQHPFPLSCVFLPAVYRFDSRMRMIRQL